MSRIRLFFQPEDQLRATREGDRTFLTVRPVWAAPMTRPNRYLCLLDGKGREICMLADPQAELDAASYQAVMAELRRRNLTSRIQRVLSAREENGAAYWSVLTDRGTRDFVTQNLSENAHWYDETRLLLLDVEGNRFEIEDLNALDSRSRALVDAIL